MIGHGDAIRWEPALSDKIDLEAELAVVIGRSTAGRVPTADTYEYVFGYACADDVTHRDLQDRDGQSTRGKSFDTFCPLGPWIVTRDEVPDPHSLPIRFAVNGEEVQRLQYRADIYRFPS